MTSAAIYAIAIAVAGATVYGVARFTARERECEGHRAAGEPGDPELHVLSRVRLGQGRSLVIVEVEGRRLLLGSTRDQWTALADLGRRAEQEDPQAILDFELSRAMNARRFGRGRRNN